MKTSWIYYYVDYRLPNLTFSCVILKNAQTYIKNHAVFTLQYFKSMFEHFSILESSNDWEILGY